jgi:uncharacterized NAD-dependent epimerase/dehydratase family protein
MPTATTPRYAVLTEGLLVGISGKTAHGVLRYRPAEIAAVVDSAFAGRCVRDVVPQLDSDAPIVASVAEAIRLGANALLIGVANDGGRLPAALRGPVLDAADAGLGIVSGLHELLGEDPEIAARSSAAGGWIRDVRRSPADLPTFTGAAYGARPFVVLTVGSDCAVGKMTALFEIERAARAAGGRAEVAATGQTGILIAGKGIPVDAVVSDFVSGAAERLVLDAAPDVDVVLVEGQGAIFHPAYAPVTFGLLYGSAPDVLVLCHRAGLTHVGGFDVPIPPLDELVRVHETLLQRVKPVSVCAIALDTSHLDAAGAAAALESTRRTTGLPVDDPVRHGGGFLWSAIDDALAATAKAQHRLTAGAR